MAFETADSWQAARELVTFSPREPADTLGRALVAIRIHVRDHRGRELPMSDRTLEAHYGSFVVSQCRKGEVEARRWALDVSYGPSPRPVLILGREGRVYEPGPEPDPSDIDGRNPAVVTWADGEMLFLVASSELTTANLIAVATSVYPRQVPTRQPRSRS